MLLLLLACAAEAPATFVAPTDDDGITVGVVVDGERVDAYVCVQGDGVALSRWLAGTREGDAATLTDAAWTLELAGLDGAPTGTLTGEAGTATWTGAAVEAPRGLYDADDAGCRTGFLWGADDAVGTWCSAEGAYVQVEPPDTLRPAEDGTLTVGVDAPDGLREVRLTPLVPGASR